MRALPPLPRWISGGQTAGDQRYRALDAGVVRRRYWL